MNEGIIMSSANVDGMLREGVNAFKAGRRDEARALLLRAVELDQYNEEAWLWLSGVLESLDDQRTCLENVLAINPNNERARQGLDYINKQLGVAPPAQEASTFPTSVEWGAPSDPAAPPPPSVEPSRDVLDQWVSNLNIGAQAPKAAIPAVPPPPPTPSPASPFANIDLDDADDIFTSGPFRADPADGDSSGTAARGGRSSAGEGSFAVPPVERTPRRERRAREAAPPKPTAPSQPVAPQFEVMFPGIPADLPATRLPGTVEGTPILLTGLVVLLVLANIALAVVFMIGFFG
jgi:hypothetical protein